MKKKELRNATFGLAIAMVLEPEVCETLSERNEHAKGNATWLDDLLGGPFYRMEATAEQPRPPCKLEPLTTSELTRGDFVKGWAALVTGVGGPAGRAVSEYFLENGIRVVRADMRPMEGERNFRVLPPASDAQFMSALTQLLDKEDIGLLVPTVTEELPKVAQRRDEIRRNGCAVFVSPFDAVWVANDKWETASALLKAAVSVPRSYCGSSKMELLETIPFPMLSKPRIGRGGRGIMIHKNDAELAERLSTDRVYQEFLSRDEYDVNLFVQPHGNSSVSVVLKKTMLKEGVVGNALAVERVEEKEVAELARRAVRALSLEGPIDIDIRRGKDGQPAILEINARVGANVRSAEEVLTAMMESWRSQR